jgi:tetratricopeptide (TPR) repeat protein
MVWLANSLNQPTLITRQFEMVALPASQWVANPISYGIKLGQHGDLLMAEQRYYMATRFFDVTETLARAGNSPTLQLAALDRLVKAYRIMGRYDLARDTLDERLEVLQKLGKPQEELATLVAQAELNQEIGRNRVAQKYYERALTLAEELKNQRQTDLIRERLSTLEGEARQ